MKKLSLLLLHIFFLGFVEEGKAMEQKESDDLILVRKNLSNAHPPLKDLMKDKIRELHFFWTTGREYDSLKQEYDANRQVNVGGSKWGKKFFPYLGEFLAATSSGLKVKFVCDRLTRESNEVFLKTLASIHDERFEVLDIEPIRRTIHEAFPKHQDLFDMVFKNATCGNPAIASDIYRLLMPLGRYNTCVYSDIDTFCNGLEHGDHQQLLNTLLGPIYSTVERQEKNNDIIRLSVSNLESLKIIVEQIAHQLKDHSEFLSSFTKLQQVVMGVDDDKGFESYLQNFGSQRFDTSAIIEITGPRLAEKMANNCLTYPVVFSLEWHPADAIKDLSDFYYHLDASASFQLETKYMQDCYFNRVCDAFDSLRFGKRHPFNIKMKTWLEKNNPYTSSLYYEELKKIRDYDLRQGTTMVNSQEVPCTTKEEWMQLKKNSLEEREKTIREKTKQKNDISRSYGFFFRFRYILHQLGIDFNILPEKLD